MLTRREALKLLSATGAAATLLSGCVSEDNPQTSGGDTPKTKHLRILATSDTHGMLVPWDYALDAEDRAGSMAQLSTAIKELRTENTRVANL